MRRWLAKIATLLGAALAALVIGTRLVLDLIGYSTSPEDAQGVPGKVQLVLDFIATQPGVLIYGVPALLIGFGALSLWAYQPVAEPAPPPSSPSSALWPDWRMDELCAHLAPHLKQVKSEAWVSVLNAIEDALSVGKLKAWGKRANGGPEKLIDDDRYWEEWELVGWCVEPASQGVQSTSKRHGPAPTEKAYRYLRVNRAQAMAIWPEPLPVKMQLKLIAGPVGIERIEEKRGFGDATVEDGELVATFVGPVRCNYLVLHASNVRMQDRRLQSDAQGFRLFFRSPEPEQVVDVDVSFVVSDDKE